MFLESQKDIVNERLQNEGSIPLRCFKPKLISSLNYEQQYLLRRKQKRNSRLKHQNYQNTITSSNECVDYEKSLNINQEERKTLDMENNFYKEVFDGNDKICGYWVNGLLEGEAEIQYHNVDYFKAFILWTFLGKFPLRRNPSFEQFRGKFEKGYKVEGLMVFKDQGSYQGAFYNEQFHGKGVLRLKDKTISAEWANGLADGSCMVEYKNGNFYYGPLKDFKKHGYGYLQFTNDSKFFDQFFDGMVKGYGEYFEKGKLKSKGLWKNAKLMQEKKEEDWSFNFEDENINWNQIEEMFEKTGPGVALCLQILLNQTAKMEGDDMFKKMLETIKRTNISSRKQKSNVFSENQCNMESEAEKMVFDEEENKLSGEFKKGLLNFFNF